MNNEENKVSSQAPAEEKKEEVVSAPKLRQIVIETDGNNIRLVKAEVTGTIELVAILRNVADHFSKNPAV